ncbi:LOW QUALITY PROTEIN: hypothetical protein U9M48_042202, partial [Paspalum notatum var. saurae]
MMTRARRRRRCSVAESTPFQAARKTQSLPPDPNEWRDWANLLPEMVDEISGRLLSADVAEYLRFRAVCRPWRSRTQDPRAHPLHRRFRPRNWMVVTMIPDPEPRRRLLNLSTAASLGVDLPALLPPVRHRRATGTEVIRLLNPLTNTVTDFPSITRIVAPTPSESQSSVLQKPGCVSPRAINGAGFDDSTFPPTLVLCPRDCASNIIFPKPGDAHWTLVSRGEARYPPFDVQGRVLYHSFISLRGRCYLTSPELQPLPRLVEVINQRHLCAPDTHHLLHIQSFLVDGNGDGRRMLMMVRCWRNVEYEHHGGAGRGAQDQMELFTAWRHAGHGVVGGGHRREEADPGEETRPPRRVCWLDALPSHSPPLQLMRYTWDTVSSALPANLEHYLAKYVDCKHVWS